MTLASKVTLFRILAIPFFIYIFSLKSNYHIAGLIFLLIALTDILDGYLARKFKEVTAIGKFLDPLADKLLVTSGLICLLEVGEITAIPVIIIVAREFMISGMRSYALTHGVSIAASPLAKLKTLGQVALIIVIIVDMELKIMPYLYKEVMIWSVVAITVWSAVDYFAKHQALIMSDQVVRAKG